MKTINKVALTAYPVADIIRERWSPRAFSERVVTETDMNTIFEAASWAASANNEQPWEYVYALQGTKGFEHLWECLMPGNKPWTKNAAVLIAAIARNTFASNGKPNNTAQHDLGMANANLFLQAVSMGIYCHPMAGFVKEKLRETVDLKPDQDPVCMIAMGYLGDPETLEEPFRSREFTPRSRKKTAEFARLYE